MEIVINGIADWLPWQATSYFICVSGINGREMMGWFQTKNEAAEYIVSYMGYTKAAPNWYVDDEGEAAFVVGMKGNWISE